MPKKIYKKWWVWVIAILILVFGFINASKTSTSTADKTDNKQEEQKTKDTESDKSKKEKEINIDEELLFLDHKLIVESVKVYEESNNILMEDRKSTRLNSSHVSISYAVFCLKKKKNKN